MHSDSNRTATTLTATNSSSVQIFPVVFDSGASISITPVKEDFIEPLKPSPISAINNLTGSTKIEHCGRVRWTVNNKNGFPVSIETTAIYLPNAEVRLFSPQTYFKENKRGMFYMDGESTFFETGVPSGGIVEIPYNGNSNLPMVIEDMYYQHKSQHPTYFASLESYKTSDILLSVTEAENQNLTSTQKQLLYWHQRLGHIGFQWLQTLLRERQRFGESIDEFDKVDSHRTFFLPSTDPKIASCPAPLCATCKLSRMTVRPRKSSSANNDKFMTLKDQDPKPGDTVSLDQYQSAVKGRLFHTRGKEQSHEQYSGGTTGVDHASGYIFHRHQVSLRTVDTIKSKHVWEHWARQCGVPIKHYHSDNGVFDSKDFKHDVQLRNQSISFSGVGAHHQNSVAKRSIRTVVELARTMMIHSAMHWPEQTDNNMWPFAMDHAIYIYNHTTNMRTGLSPIKVFTNTRYDYTKLLQRLHVWGAPRFVLDPTLQDRKKLPKREPRFRRGQYLGVSLRHSSSVGLIRNIKTGNVSAQFHVVYDDHYQTVTSKIDLNSNNIDTKFWQELLQTSTENYLDDIAPSDLPVLPRLDPERQPSPSPPHQP